MPSEANIDFIGTLPSHQTVREMNGNGVFNDMNKKTDLFQVKMQGYAGR
jgi:hypothetical protein